MILETHLKSLRGAYRTHDAARLGPACATVEGRASAFRPQAVLTAAGVRSALSASAANILRLLNKII